MYILSRPPSLLVGGTTCTHLMLTKTVCDEGLLEGKAQAGGEAISEGSGEGLALGQTPEDEDPRSHGQ